MKKSILILFSANLLLIGCEKEKEIDPFLISAERVGFLTKDTQVRELDSVFSKDSIVVQKQKGIFESGNEIVVYDKNGTKLLMMEPVQDFDTTSTIGTIRIIDPRFKTKTGFGTQSVFKNLIANYEISRVENTLNAIIIFIDELNAYVTIEKKDLPAKLQLDIGETIEADQIPENAPITYFWIGWE